MKIETKIAKNGTKMYYVDGKRVSRENALEAAAINREGKSFTVEYNDYNYATVDKLEVKVQQAAHRYDVMFNVMVGKNLVALPCAYKLDKTAIKNARTAAGKIVDAIAAAYINGASVVKIVGNTVEVKAEIAIVETPTVEDKDELPSGYITVNSGTEAWAIVGKHFPKDNLEFCRAGKGFNNEDTFCYTLDEIIYVHATCTPDNKRVKCIEIVNTYEESESERNILTVYINHDAATESAMEDAKTTEVDKSATAKFEAGKTYFEFWYEDTGLKHKQVYTVEKRTDKTITVGGKRYKIFLSDYGDGEYARVSYTKRVYAKNIYTELEVDKDATADSLTRAMTIALEHYQDFCRVGNLTAATNELSLYNICRKAMTELYKERTV